MAKYFLAYVGGQSGVPSSPDEQQKLMQAWAAWMGGLRDRMVDGGAPLGPPSSVSSSGVVSEGGTSRIGGYSIINADSVEHAVTATKGCPHLAQGGTIEIFEMLEVPAG